MFVGNRVSPSRIQFCAIRGSSAAIAAPTAAYSEGRVHEDLRTDRWRLHVSGRHWSAEPLRAHAADELRPASYGLRNQGSKSHAVCRLPQSLHPPNV